MNKNAKKWRCNFLHNILIRFSTVVFLCAIAPYAVAANKGNISAAVTTLIVGAVVAVLISLIFALQKNQDGKLVGIKTGKFFLLVSILLLIVFVTSTASFFLFM
jgi:heme/copper-type cytochrome/quinol oxidase subunit 4